MTPTVVRFAQRGQQIGVVTTYTTNDGNEAATFQIYRTWAISNMPGRNGKVTDLVHSEMWWTAASAITTFDGWVETGEINV